MCRSKAKLALLLCFLFRLTGSLSLEDMFSSSYKSLNIPVAVYKISEATNQSYVTQGNFLIYSFNLKKINMTGLIFRNNQPPILEDIRDVYNVSSSYSFQSALILGPLSEKVEEDVKMVVMVYPIHHVKERSPKRTFVGKIFGVVFPDANRFPGTITILQRVAPNEHRQYDCWLYNNPQEVKGSWKKTDVGKNLSNTIRCDFLLPKHFALFLIDIAKSREIALDLIITTNCILSLAGLSCILFTAIVFRCWRTKIQNQVQFNLSVSIALETSIFYAARYSNETSSYTRCATIGALLHYSLLTEFSWMLIIVLLSKRFFQDPDTRPRRILLKSYFGGWAVPFVPVLYTLLFDGDNYVAGHVGLCYPSGLGLYLGILSPLAPIVATTAILFVDFVYKVRQRAQGSKNETVHTLGVSLLTFFMLAATWTCGILAEVDFGEVIVYIFSVTATLQGFVVFLLFVVFDVATRDLYVTAIHNCFNKLKF